MAELFLLETWYCYIWLCVWESMGKRARSWESTSLVSRPPTRGTSSFFWAES